MPAGRRCHRQEAGQHGLRRSRGRLRWRDARPRLHQKGTSSGGTPGPRQWRLRIHRFRRRATRHILWGGGHGGVQHEEPGAGAIPGRRSCHRLHTRGLHQVRSDVRRRLRRGRQELVPALQQPAQAGRGLPLLGAWLPGAESSAGALDPGDRRQEDQVPDPQSEPEGRVPFQGARRGRQVQGGHRQTLSFGADRRGLPLRRDGAEDREMS